MLELTYLCPKCNVTHTCVMVYGEEGRRYVLDEIKELSLTEYTVTHDGKDITRIVKLAILFGDMIANALKL